MAFEPANNAVCDKDLAQRSYIFNLFKCIIMLMKCLYSSSYITTVYDQPIYFSELHEGGTVIILIL